MFSLHSPVAVSPLFATTPHLPSPHGLAPDRQAHESIDHNTIYAPQSLSSENGRDHILSLAGEGSALHTMQNSRGGNMEHARTSHGFKAGGPSSMNAGNSSKGGLLTSIVTENASIEEDANPVSRSDRLDISNLSSGKISKMFQAGQDVPKHFLNSRPLAWTNRHTYARTGIRPLYVPIDHMQERVGSFWLR